MHRHRFNRGSRPALAFCLLFLLSGLVPRGSAHVDLLVQLEDINQQIAKDPKNVDLYLRRGELHRVHMDWDNALADFNYILTIEPGNTSVDYAKGRLMSDANWLLSAKGYLDRFISTHPRHAEAFTTRARVYTRLGLHQASAEDYDVSVSLSPEPGPEMFIERAQTLAALGPGHVNKAIEGLDEGIKRIGPLVTIQLLAIDLEVKRTNFTGAIERVDGITQRSPRKETWLTRRAEILEQAGRPDEARQSYQAALAALASLPPVRRNVPAMSHLERRIRTQLESINAAHPLQK